MTRRRKLIYLVAAVAVGAVIVVLVSLVQAAHYRETFREARGISGGDYVTLESLINVHGSRTHYLDVLGQRYDLVRGLPPFYLEIPALNTIFFVIDNGVNDEFVFVNLQTHQATRIAVGDTAFGTDFSHSHDPTEWSAEYVVVKPDGRVVVYKNYATTTACLEVDLVHGRLVSKNTEPREPKP